MLELLSLKGLTMWYTRITARHPKRLIKMAYHKLYDQRKYPGAFEIQQKYPLIAKFNKTIERLLNLVHATYLDNRESTTKQIIPNWLKSDKFATRGDNLIQIFQMTLIAMELIFGFSTRSEAENLIPFCDQVFEGVFHFTHQWRALDYFLQFFHSQNAISENKKIWTLCLDNPKQALGYLENHQRLCKPETYRDILIKNIEDNEKRKKSLFWKGNVRSKDEPLYRFYIMCQHYQQPEKFGLMYLKRATKAETDCQLHRHNLLRYQYETKQNKESSSSHKSDSDTMDQEKDNQSQTSTKTCPPLRFLNFDADYSDEDYDLLEKDNPNSKTKYGHDESEDEDEDEDDDDDKSLKSANSSRESQSNIEKDGKNYIVNSISRQVQTLSTRETENSNQEPPKIFFVRIYANNSACAPI